MHFAPQSSLQEIEKGRSETRAEFWRIHAPQLDTFKKQQESEIFQDYEGSRDTAEKQMYITENRLKAEREKQDRLEQQRQAAKEKLNKHWQQQNEQGQEQQQKSQASQTLKTDWKRQQQQARERLKHHQSQSSQTPEQDNQQAPPQPEQDQNQDPALEQQRKDARERLDQHRSRPGQEQGREM